MTGATPIGSVARPPRTPKSPPPQITSSTAINAFAAAIANAPTRHTAHAVSDAFWQTVAARGTPLVEPRGTQRAVTFLWRDRHGTGLGTRTVALLANKLTDPSVWPESQLHRIEGTDVWHRTYLLPSAWHGSYQVAPDDGAVPAAAAQGPADGPRIRWAGLATRAVPDPFCQQHLPGRPGEPALSVATLDGAPTQHWREPRDDVPRGTLRETTAPLLGHNRRCWIYEPPVRDAAAPTPHNLLVVLDGEDWATRLALPTTLDNLIADGAIPPTAAVLVDAIDTPTRWRELACSDAFSTALATELRGWAGRELPGCLGGRTMLSGRSLGGLTALWIAREHPTAFDVIHAQSPSLWWPAGSEPDRQAGWLAAALASAPHPLPQLHIDVGRQEWMLLTPARELAAAAGNRTAVHLAEYEGGHDVWCWRGALARALVAAHAARA
jgi:enterochelin esterase-like enzyme